MPKKLIQVKMPQRDSLDLQTFCTFCTTESSLGSQTLAQTCQIFLAKKNRWHWSCSHCSTGLVPVHNIFFIGFSSQQKICLLKCLFEHFILQLPLAFRHGNSPSIPRIQARMQWCLCPLSENSLQHFGYGEINAKWWNWWNRELVKPVGPTCMFAGRFSMTTKSETNSWKC